MIPKFLIADNSQDAKDKVFVVHTEKPRCFIECDVDGFYSHQKIHWIDRAIDGGELEDLLDLAEEFFEAELAYQEYLYDEEE